MPLPQAIPMIHVPDVWATVEWYEHIGFSVAGLHTEPSGEATWAQLTFGETQVMLNAGGRPSTADRREVDLYLVVDEIGPLLQRMQGHAEFVEDVHDTEYGMREFIVRDCNRFWITVGQRMPGAAQADLQSRSGT
ncbi:MAG TPA: VOC family protein [Gemmatimonadaceae bacterium]|nr:VOC family protein [Gemmatimonadaceae bacterium]